MFGRAIARPSIEGRMMAWPCVLATGLAGQLLGPPLKEDQRNMTARIVTSFGRAIARPSIEGRQ